MKSIKKRYIMPFTQNTSRFLSAVMFTDIVGYTTLMQEDERQAVGIRNKQRNILRKHLAEYRGTVVQYYGDGALVIFSSVFWAVLCAVKMQLELQKESISVRVGIHLGDIVRDNEGVYGDAVNVAARLESLSTPGSVFISKEVLRELKNKQGIKAVYIGTFMLKNIAHPVQVYTVSNKKKTFVGENLQQAVEKKLFKKVQTELARQFMSKVTNAFIN